MSRTKIHRRSFLAATGASSLMIVSPRSVWSYAANEKLNTALIGAGGRGDAHIGVAAEQNFVAMADCDEGCLAARRKQYPKTKTYHDYRKLFDAHKDLNAVFVATPDHHHFPASMLAIEHGAGVYTEKPLTHSVWEARRLAEFARQKNVATQLGNQGHSGEGCRRLCELIWGGGLGDVTEVHCRTTWDFGAVLRGCQECRAHPRRSELGGLVRAVADAAVPARTAPVLVARVVGLRHGCPGRSVLPRHGRGLLALKLAEADAVEVSAETSAPAALCFRTGRSSPTSSPPAPAWCP